MIGIHIRHAPLRVATLIAAAAIGLPRCGGQGIEPFHAQEVQPDRPAAAKSQQPASQAPKATTVEIVKPKTSAPLLPPPPLTKKLEPAASKPAAATDNLVEPLSNGLLLSWTSREIKNKFGAGQPSWDARTITYAGFRVAVGGGEEKIWHLHITDAAVSLNSGLRPGSTKTDVGRVFGSSDRAKHGQYQLTFQYDGDKLIDIGIDPAEGEFRPFAPPAPDASKAKDPKPAATSILGKWWGVQSMTQIDVNADGTYTSPNGGKGTWTMTGDEIVFTGALAGWNNGQAKLTKGGWIEFLWKDKSGAAFLFQLVRR